MKNEGIYLMAHLTTENHKCEVSGHVAFRKQKGQNPHTMYAKNAAESVFLVDQE